MDLHDTLKVKEPIIVPEEYPEYEELPEVWDEVLSGVEENFPEFKQHSLLARRI